MFSLMGKNTVKMFILPKAIYLLLLLSPQVMSDSVTPWTAACQVPLSFTISWNLLKFMFIESMMPSNQLILCLPLLLLPSIFPSIRVFSNESALHHPLIQCNSYQDSYSIFFLNRSIKNNPNIYMEPQKNPNSQISPEKEEQSGRHHTSWFQAI